MHKTYLLNFMVLIFLGVDGEKYGVLHKALPGGLIGLLTFICGGMA